MNHLLIVTCACVVLIQIANGKFIENVIENVTGREQFELREGNCSGASLNDEVFQDHVHLTRIPFVTRNTTSSWHGDEKLYCIIALSAKEESKGSTVFIKDGGLNHSYVTLEFHSKKNHGLEYNIQLFGKLKRSH